MLIKKATIALSSLLWLSLAFSTLNAAELGDDGLHKQDWFAITFRDVAEDISDAAESGKRLAIVFEQPGCSYCAQTHNTVLADPEIVDYLKEHYVIVQYNLYGDEEVTDLDGEVLTEKTAAEKWGVMFTPNWIFLDDTAGTGKSVAEAAVGSMPGAFAKGTFIDLFNWVYDKGYEGDEAFQRYHARMVDVRRERAKTKGEPAPVD